MDWREYAGRMAILARDLLAEDSVQATLDAITVAAVKLVDGLRRAGRPGAARGRVRS